MLSNELAPTHISLGISDYPYISLCCMRVQSGIFRDTLGLGSGQDVFESVGSLQGSLQL